MAHEQSVKLSPVTITSLAGLSEDWSDPGNAAAPDDSYATVALSVGSPNSDLLRSVAYDFSSIPTGVTITGLGATIEAKYTGASAGAKIGSAQIVDGGFGVGNIDNTDKTLTTSDVDYTYGGSGVLWGITPSRADLDAEFGYQIVAVRTSGDPTVGVDFTPFTVFWTETRELTNRGISTGVRVGL